MKRFVTIITICVFLGYILMTMAVVTPNLFKKSYIRKTTNKVKYGIGIGVLFDRPNTLVGKSVTYRFYQHGAWQKNQQLLEPLFEEYSTTGNFAALKHCRLDAHLVRKIHTVSKHSGNTKMFKSNAFAAFKDHLLYSHNNKIKPDSIEVYYYIENFETNSMDLLLKFKCKP